MNARTLSRYGAAFGTLLLASQAFAETGPRSQRRFELTYSAQIQEIPESAKSVEIWIPYPISDENQLVTNVRVETPANGKIRREQSFGNSMLHLELEKPKGPIDLALRFDVERRELRRKDFPQSQAGECASYTPEVGRWLTPERLVPLSERIQNLAKEVTAGKVSYLDKARAIYDYVVQVMAYDKSGTGWGNGDIYWACDAKRGNCTDFHALFIGLTRAVGIPAKFEIGFPIPADKDQGEIGGYHCWAEFYLPGYGWVPVDASEAKKQPEKQEYFFGALDANRVQLTVGRDLPLAPRQQGDPLNYFIYPYIEVDGTPHATMTKKFSFREIKDDPAASR